MNPPVLRTPEERSAYVRGALTVCLEMDLSEERVVELCAALRIAPEELVDLRDRLLAPRAPS